jgi:hypothetical protein
MLASVRIQTQEVSLIFINSQFSFVQISQVFSSKINTMYKENETKKSKLI